MPPDPPSGQITLLSVQQSRFGWDSPDTRFPTNLQSGKKILEMYEDIDAPSVVTVLLYMYQLKYADAVISGVM